MVGPQDPSPLHLACFKIRQLHSTHNLVAAGATAMTRGVSWPQRKATKGDTVISTSDTVLSGNPASSFPSYPPFHSYPSRVILSSCLCACMVLDVEFYLNSPISFSPRRQRISVLPTVSACSLFVSSLLLCIVFNLTFGLDQESFRILIGSKPSR
jgi:hypothetical protein